MTAHCPTIPYLHVDAIKSSGCYQNRQKNCLLFYNTKSQLKSLVASDKFIFNGGHFGENVNISSNSVTYQFDQ